MNATDLSPAALVLTRDPLPAFCTAIVELRIGGSDARAWTRPAGNGAAPGAARPSGRGGAEILAFLRPGPATRH